MSKNEKRITKNEKRKMKNKLTSPELECRKTKKEKQTNFTLLNNICTFTFLRGANCQNLCCERNGATGYVTQANRNITCSYLDVLNCNEKYVNDKDCNQTKQRVWNSIDPQQMLDRGMIRLDTFLYRLDTDRIE